MLEPILMPLLAIICVIELLGIIVLSGCVLLQRHAKQEELNAIATELRAKADNYGENTSGASQCIASLLYGFVDRLQEL